MDAQSFSAKGFHKSSRGSLLSLQDSDGSLTSAWWDKALTNIANAMLPLATRSMHTAGGGGGGVPCSALGEGCGWQCQQSMMGDNDAAGQDNSVGL
ncbi:unnamed protein product [Boreogadus saida]